MRRSRLDEREVAPRLRTAGCTSLAPNTAAVHRLVVLVRHIGLLVAGQAVEGAHAPAGRTVADQEEVDKIERAGLGAVGKTGYGVSGQGQAARKQQHEELDPEEAHRS